MALRFSRHTKVDERLKPEMRSSAMRPSHLFYIVDWLPPDFGAVGQYALIFARDFAKAGRAVSLIGLTSGMKQTRAEAFGKGALEIKSIPAQRYNKSGLVTRLLWSVRTKYSINIGGGKRPTISRSGNTFYRVTTLYVVLCRFC